VFYPLGDIIAELKALPPGAENVKDSRAPPATPLLSAGDR
jgi:hypothetical protein